MKIQGPVSQTIESELKTSKTGIFFSKVQTLNKLIGVSRVTGVTQQDDVSSGSTASLEGSSCTNNSPVVTLAESSEPTRRRKTSSSSLLRAIMRIDNPFNLDSFICNLLALKKHPGKNVSNK